MGFLRQLLFFPLQTAQNLWDWKIIEFPSQLFLRHQR